MDLILLGGENQASNEQWITDIEAAVKESFDSTHVVRYDHWGGSGPTRLEVEILRLNTLLRGRSGAYAIFAKSFGGLL